MKTRKIMHDAKGWFISTYLPDLCAWSNTRYYTTRDQAREVMRNMRIDDKANAIDAAREVRRVGK